MRNLIHKTLEVNINYLKKKFHESDDLAVRKLLFDTSKELIVNLIYLDGIVNKDNLQEYVIKPLLDSTSTKKIPFNNSLIDVIASKVIQTAEVSMTNCYEELSEAILKGNTVILFEGFNRGIIAETVQLKERSLEQATSERSVRGPFIGLTEKLTTNVNLLRGMVKTSDLHIENKELGYISKGEVSLLYINGVVDHKVLTQVRQLIDKVSVKYLLEARVITEEIDGKYSFFTLYEETERPDVIVGALFDGKVIVLVDGIPFGIILPGLFTSAFQSPDEYHLKSGRLTIRLLRFMAFVITVFLPGVYVTMEKFYSDDIPIKIAKTLFEDGELLSPVWSMLILLFLYTVLIDAAFRIPQNTIVFISLVATIAIGETAITGNIIHPLSLIFIGITFLTSFPITNKGMYGSINTFRILFLLVGYFFDFVGIIIGTTLLVIYMVNLRSVGVPFLTPIIPFRIEELKDVLYRSRYERFINSKHSYPNDN
jgi:spore germination protein KA